MIITVIASAMTVLVVFHAETDNSSAEVTESGWCGENTYYCIYSDGTLLIDGSGAMYDYRGFTHAPWYEHRDEITTIVIGNQILQLGQWAFVGLKHVTELSIPVTLNSVVSDTYPAFAGCYRIETIEFTFGNNGCCPDYSAYEGNNNWYQLTPWYQSRDCLKEIRFADGTKSIGADAFRELNITSVILPESVTSLGCHCFYNCAELTDLSIPVSLNSYGNEDYPAFAGCTAVQKVIFTRGNGVPFDYSYGWSSVAHNAELAPWNMNSNIVKTIVIADNVTKLGKCMFNYCNIGELTIPVNAICGDIKAFCRDKGSYDCFEKVTITKGTGNGNDYTYFYATHYLPWNRAPNLCSLVVEDGVTKLGDRTFYHCSAETVILPDSLVALGRYTFADCAMNYLTIPISLNAVWSDDFPAFISVTGLQKVNFTVGSGYGFDYAAYTGHNAYYKRTPWYQSQYNIELNFAEGIKRIGSEAFRDQTLISVEIPNTVEALGSHVFYNCGVLTSLTIPITLNSVGSEQYPAFEGDNCLKFLRLTPGTTGIGCNYVGSSPFWNYKSSLVASVTLDHGITYIGTNTFTEYSFYNDGQPLEMTAANLSGYVFHNVGHNVMELFSEAPDTVSNTSNAGCNTEVSSAVAQQTVSENRYAGRPIPLNNPVFEKEMSYDHISLCPEVLPTNMNSKYL